MVGKQGTGFTYTTFEDSLTLYIPLQFWFCNNPGLALPLIALQHSRVRFYVELRKLKNVLYQQLVNIERNTANNKNGFNG